MGDYFMGYEGGYWEFRLCFSILDPKPGRAFRGH